MKKLVNESDAVRTLMRLLPIPGVSRHEGAVARHVRRELLSCGVATKAVSFDRARARFPFEAECGNLIAMVNGRGARARAKPRLLSAHLDTVDLASGATPVRRGGRIVPRGETALGADDRSGVAVLVTVAKTLARLQVDHPPLVLLFTVCEEAGLWGSRFVDPALVRACEFGFNFDGSAPEELCVGAPSQIRFTIDIEGVPSHAGVAPEKGVSATVAFAKATSRLSAGGWLGKVLKGRNRGTSNIGVVAGGLATNIVTPRVKAEGEARSYSEAFLRRMLDAFRSAFRAAAATTRNDRGARAKARIEVTRLYDTFDLGETSPVVREAARAAREVGLRPVYKRQFGGLDANWLNAHGLPTVTLGTGGHDAHGTSETLALKEYLASCEMALRMAGIASA